MKLLGLLLTPALLFSQATLTVKGPATVRAGKSLTLNLELSGSQNSIAALQWSLGFPSNWTVTSAAGTSLKTSEKTLYCNQTSTICLAVGINTNLILDGQVVTHTLSVPRNSTGLVSIPLSGLVAASLPGDGISLVSGTPYSVTVYPIVDINSDGRLDILDVQLMVGQATGSSSCVDDINADGKCDVLDVYLVAKAAIGV